MCAGEWPCLWQCCDVVICGWAAMPGLAVVDVTWYDARKMHGWGRGDWTKALFYFCLFFISLSHTCTQTSSLCPIHCRLPCSVNLICPTMLPPTFLRSLILSCSFSIPLSLIFFLTPALSRFPQWAVSLSRSAEQRAWVRLHTGLQ